MLPRFRPSGADAEDAHAAHAVEGLEDDVAVLGVEALDLGLAARHERRRDELRELEDRELLGIGTSIISDRVDDRVNSIHNVKTAKGKTYRKYAAGKWPEHFDDGAGWPAVD